MTVVSTYSIFFAQLGGSVILFTTSVSFFRGYSFSGAGTSTAVVQVVLLRLSSLVGLRFSGVSVTSFVYNRCKPWLPFRGSGPILAP